MAGLVRMEHVEVIALVTAMPQMLLPFTVEVLVTVQLVGAR